jgi:serine/threonine-protein kinase
MELVEGEDLARVIARGPIPLDDALAIAQQIARALEAAHDAGIVHRDLKPANVKVRPDGTTKVLDFGLARVADPALASGANVADSPTVTGYATETGVILGTAAYMSPEQARGKMVDKRADIWAFGAVLYEMIAGRRAFGGANITDTLSAVVRDTPNWSALPPTTPPRLRRLIERCLDRDAAERLRDIGEARIELSKVASGAPDTSGASVNPDSGPVAPIAPHPRRWRMGVVVGVVAATSLVTAGAMWALRPAPPVAPPVRFTIQLPPGMRIGSTQRVVLTVSPDGRFIAYTATPPAALYLRAVDAFDAAPIKGTEDRIATEPVFSPDGSSIVYWASLEQTLQTVPVAGGNPRTLCRTELPSGLSWSADGIVFTNTDGVFKIAPDGGDPVQLLKASPSTTIFQPQLLPGGHALLYTQADARGGTERWDSGRVIVQPLNGAPKVLIENATDGRYVASGHVLFARAGVVYAAAFDVASLSLASKEVPVVDGVLRGTGTFGAGTIHLDVSASGVLAYVPGPLVPQASTVHIAWFDFAGKVQTLLPAPRAYQTPRLSPDGTRIAFVVDDGSEANVWVYDVGTAQAPRRLSFGGNSRSPVWTADGRRVVYRSDRDGPTAIYWQAGDGSGVAERLTPPTQGTSDVPEAFSPDGQRLLFDRVSNGRAQLWQLSLGARQASRVGTIESSQLTGATFSPDGRWMAYSTREPGQKNVLFVDPVPETGARYQISGSVEDAHHPVWSPDGNDLFYTPGPGSRIMRVRVVREPTFSFSSPETLPRPFANNAGSSDRPYDIARDGRRFLSTTDVALEPGHGDSIDVVVNWFSELRAKVGR